MENDLCCNCKHFDCYFTKGVKNFRKTQFGWCNKKFKVAFAKNSCDKFAPKPTNRRNEQFALYCLNDLLTELTHVRCVLEENRREKNETETL